MANKPDDAVLGDLYQRGLTDKKIAAAASVSDDAVFRWRKRMGLEANGGNYGRTLKASATEKPFEIDELPSETPTAVELLERRIRDYSRKEVAKKARRLIPVTVNVEGPFGIAHFGDPHVDDDGTDLAMLRNHIDVVNRTPALFAGNVGDYSNNWVGRLARLYGEQSTSAAEAWVLVEWLLRSCDWLYLVGGNHDAWSGAGDPLKWISRQQGALMEKHGMRLSLNLPSGRSVRINARHDFKGHSMYNTAHGPAKAAMLGWRDHILGCGHTHVSGYNILKDPSNGLITHAIRIASYKLMDRYADELNLPDQTIFNCPVTIIDPKYADNDARFITFIMDPEEGADFLSWKRSKKAA